MANNPYTTLISCRIDNQTLKAIDKFCKDRPCFNRSNVINQALSRIFRDSEDYEIYDFLYNALPLKLPWI